MPARVSLHDQRLGDVFLGHEAAPDQQRTERLRPRMRARRRASRRFGRVEIEGVVAPLPLRPGDSLCSFPFVVVCGSLFASQFHLSPSFYGGACVNVKTADVVYGLAPPDGVVTVTKNDWPMVAERVGEGRDPVFETTWTAGSRLWFPGVTTVPPLSCVMVTVAPLMNPLPVMVIAVLWVV